MKVKKLVSSEDIKVIMNSVTYHFIGIASVVVHLVHVMANSIHVVHIVMIWRS